MSILVEINLNVAPLHRLIITRLEGTTDPDSINEYICTLMTITGGDTEHTIGTSLPYYIEHRYGDGALILVQKALALINRPKESTP